MSRGYNVRRKAKRQQARAATKAPQRERSARSFGPAVFLPIIAIIAILLVTAIVGLSGGADTKNRKQVSQEVTALLAGIPQNGSILGAPKARVTLKIFADLECPTVKTFVQLYLPTIIDVWVRSGGVNLEYSPLKTDTGDEREFFKQETATLAAGEQGKLWNFALTFVHEQGQKGTGYATPSFLNNIASQVPGLELARWRHDSKDPLLFRPVALSVHSAHVQKIRYTPSFVLVGPEIMASTEKELVATLEKDITALQAEAPIDIPTLLANGTT